MFQPLLTRLLTTLVALALVLATGATALAQDATPDASPTAGGAGPRVGDAVLLFSNSGREEAQVAVTQIVDPFEDVESETQRGFHYVMVELVVENLSDNPYDFNPYLLSLVDAEGFTYQATFASRSSEAVTALPDFQPGTLEPGQSASGVLFFEVIDGTSVGLIAYSDGFERFTILVDQREGVPGEGEAVTVYDSQGQDAGTVSVDQIVTGLEEEDNSISLDRGQTAVAVVLTVTASGEADLVSPANGIRIVDEFGFSFFPAFTSRSEESLAQLPDFPTEDIASGSSATGAIIFAIPAEAIVTYVLYQPEFTKLTIVGQPGEGSVVSGDQLEPVAVPTEETTDEPVDEPTEETTDEPVEDETPVALTGDCADLQGWLDATEKNLAALDDLDPLNAEVYVAGDLRDAADALRETADAQGDIDTPEIAEVGQESIISFLEAYADLLEQGADDLDDGIDSSDIFDTAFVEGPFVDAVTEFTDVASDLQAACPDADFGDLV